VNVPETARVEGIRREGSNSLTIRLSWYPKKNRYIRGMTKTLVSDLLSSAREILSVGTGEDYVRWLGWGIDVAQVDSAHLSVELFFAQKSEGVQRQISQARTKSQ
jgi:hypothetical protein